MCIYKYVYESCALCQHFAYSSSTIHLTSFYAAKTRGFQVHRANWRQYNNWLSIKYLCSLLYIYATSVHTFIVIRIYICTCRQCAYVPMYSCQVFIFLFLLYFFSSAFLSLLALETYVVIVEQKKHNKADLNDICIWICIHLYTYLYYVIV